MPSNHANGGPIKTATGVSHTPGAAAAREAVTQARGSLGEVAPAVGIVFASPSRPLDEVLRAARDASPGTEFMGCHTAGEFTESGLVNNGVVVMLLGGGGWVHDLRLARGLKSDVAAAGRTLCEGYEASLKAAGERGLYHSSTVMLVDGLSGCGEALVKELRTGTRVFQQIIGGAAGDDGAFKATAVGARGESATDASAALHVFTKVQWGVGVDHGLTPATTRMDVTRAKGNVVYEIDRKPAFQVYQAFAQQRGTTLTPANTNKFLIAHELGLYFLDTLTRARAPLAVGPAGELICAAEIPEGAAICILDGEPTSMIRAAEAAAKDALAGLKGHPAAGVLVFDCICRGLILDQAFDQEIAAIRGVFPGVPIAGFRTYGEIARYKGKFDGWHNSTCVVVAIPA